MGEDLEIYSVQRGKPWYRRKVQAEWDSCRWAQRGYTEQGVIVMAAIRRLHPSIDSAYIRAKIVGRWFSGYDDGWYRTRYTITGTPRNFDEAVLEA